MSPASGSERVSRPALEVRPLSPDRFDDVVELFGTKGDPSWCWCQYFLTTGSGYLGTRTANREALRSQAGNDPAPGLLAYEDTMPVGWVQVGPAPTYPRWQGNRALREVVGDDLDDPEVWAVTCFVVKVGRRRRGIATVLLEAAVEAARSAGARVLYGHPVDVEARGRRSASADLYHGTLAMFAAAGSSEVGRTGPTRAVVRLPLA